MYDVFCKSAIFGIRNADKVANTDDKGRIFADVGQFTNAAKAAAQLDNALGKGAQAAINVMTEAAKGNKALDTIAKGANWASKNVNPLLIGAAGYRVIVADDKEQALKREVLGMTSMFAVEGAMKEALQSNYMKSFRAGIKNKYAKIALSILEGVGFVCGSIAGSTVGYKIGSELYPDKKVKKSEKTAEIKDADKTDKQNNVTAKTDVKNDKKAAVLNKDEMDDYEKEFFETRESNKLMA